MMIQISRWTMNFELQLGWIYHVKSVSEEKLLSKLPPHVGQKAFQAIAGTLKS